MMTKLPAWQISANKAALEWCKARYVSPEAMVRWTAHMKAGAKALSKQVDEIVLEVSEEYKHEN